MTADYVQVEKDRDLAIVWLDQAGSKVNTISPDALSALAEALDEIDQDDAIRAIIFISRKPDTFIAGADLDVLRRFETPDDVHALTRQGHALIRRVRALDIPTVAAIHGAAMGGGLEVALACSYRIATNHARTRLALPEVQLGLLPGGGGTQFLPRLVGIQQALTMMLTGKNVYPRKAKRIGLVDALTYRDGLLDAAKQAARALADGALTPHRDNQDVQDKLLESNPLSRRLIYQQAASRARKESKGNYPAPFKIIECVKTGMEDGLDAGLEAEMNGFAELVFTKESQALVSLFFAKQSAEKNPWKDQTRPVETLGVLGAGLMGAGIAEVSADNGMAVIVKDIDLSTAAQARKHIWQSIAKKVEKKIISAFDRDQLIERVVPIADYNALHDADLVIEAVPEHLDLKRSVLADTEAVTRDDCIFASNTSSIPIAEIAEAAERPAQVLGMHYFSPVPQMPLMELIKTDQTAEWALATAFETGLRQGKTIIVVNDGPGFYTTRILGVYMNEALRMLEEGAAIEVVDEAMEQFGFPMGPYELFDLVGIDVAAKITEVMGRYMTDRDLPLTDAARTLIDAGYTGQKGGVGFYHYAVNGREGAEKKDLNEAIYAFFGGPARTTVEAEAVQQRLGLLMVNEAVRCLEDGILDSARDGDLGAVFGLGFPPFTGGPFRYVDTETAPAIAARLARLQLQHGAHYAPAPSLLDKAKTGARFYASERR